MYSEAFYNSLYIAIRTKVASLELPPGSILTLPELCEHFDVSTHCIRTALFRLDHDGLVSTHKQRGTHVNKIDPITTATSIYVILALQVSIIRDITKNTENNFRRNLTDINDVIRDLEESILSGDIDRAFKYDNIFNTQIASLAGFPNVIHIVERERVHVERVLRLSIRKTADYMELLHLNRNIVDGIRNDIASMAINSAQTYAEKILAYLEKWRSEVPEYFTEQTLSSSIASQ